MMPEFFSNWMQRAFRFANIYFISGAKTTIAHLPQEKLKLLPIPKPTIEEQKEITEVLQACDEKISALENEINLLNEFFKAMLEELMSGNLSSVPLIEN